MGNSGQFAIDFGNRLRQIRAALNVSQGEAASKAGGFRTDTWSRIERGASAGIPIDMLGGILAWVSGAGFSVTWLLCGRGDMREKALASLPPEPAARQILDVIRQALAGPASGGEAAPPPFVVREIVEPGYKTIPAEDLDERGTWRGRYVPIINRIAAGEGVDTAEAEAYSPGAASEYLQFDGAPPGAFAVLVAGDSMEPEYRDRDLVIVDPARPKESGVACVIEERDGDRYPRLKWLQRRGKEVLLKSLNPAYGPKRIPASQIVGAYAVIATLPVLKREKSP